MNQSGTTGQISSSTSRRNASAVSIGPTGTATTMRDGACKRTAWIAAIIEAPVARPSSIRITT
ncbi:hypothetical protein D3C86_1995430 [compost metagenome]